MGEEITAIAISYTTNTGGRINYKVEGPLDAETIGIILKLMDGIELEDICSGLH